MISTTTGKYAVNTLNRLTAVILLSACAQFAHAQQASVAQLAWMTGYWQGPVGENTLEENWNAPLSGTIASTVRMAGKSGTQMVELVIIREHEGSLLLTLQQFNPDFTPRSPAPQVMKLVESTENSVSFADRDNTPGLRTLKYTRGADNTFTVEAGLPDGNVFKAVLKAH